MLLLTELGLMLKFLYYCNKQIVLDSVKQMHI